MAADAKKAAGTEARFVVIVTMPDGWTCRSDPLDPVSAYLTTALFRTQGLFSGFERATRRLMEVPFGVPVSKTISGWRPIPVTQCRYCGN